MRCKGWVCAAAMVGSSLANSECLAAPLPAADFFRLPQVVDVALSPSGRYLAVESRRENGMVQLTVTDLDHPEDARVVAGLRDMDVAEAQWVNDDWLVFAAFDSSIHRDVWYSQPNGWFSVKRDGTRLQRDVLGVNPLPPIRLRDGSPNVMVVRTNGARHHPTHALWRVDARSGSAVAASEGGPTHPMEWLFDESGEVRATMAQEGDRKVLYRRDAKTWVRVSEQPLFEVGPVELHAYRFGKAYVLAAAGEGGQRALFEYDLGSGKRADKPLVIVQHYDFKGELVFDDESKQLIGIRHLTEDWSTTWLDPQMQALQKRIDELLPGMLNQIDCASRCSASRHVVVKSHADRWPTSYSLFDRNSGELRSLGASRPWIDPEHMGQRDVMRFSARDGLSIPVTVTYPPGGRRSDTPRPGIVLIHDGPWSRGATWGWSATAQFLASRGYVVLEPEYRGSDGFGERHLKAGFKQWGLAMQDDIADTAKWAADVKMIDPKRVCLAGEGYGGYSALMGLVRNADQFRCGISWNAPTDIDAMYAFDWSSTSEVFTAYGMPKLIADREADVGQIAATSPLRQAERIKQPLLLAHGAKDKVYPVEHGIRLRKALEASNGRVEWVEYRVEGHGWSRLDTKVDFWTRAEHFLAKHLQGTDTAQP